jgi:hypothetical protein
MLKTSYVNSSYMLDGFRYYFVKVNGHTGGIPTLEELVIVNLWLSIR